MLGWDGEAESLSTGIQDNVSKLVGELLGLWRGDLGGNNVFKGVPGEAGRKKLGDNGEAG